MLILWDVTQLSTVSFPCVLTPCQHRNSFFFSWGSHKGTLQRTALHCPPVGGVKKGNPLFLSNNQLDMGHYGALYCG
uniref:Uncharacterized protein n=1 Tax=Anguilla anguilla TaxID=7936 RepID=A0A0E9PV01_ANGAN